jgi:ribosomal protein S12 methylthiotransferase
MKTFYIHRLGCPKNDVDADYIAGYLQSLDLTETDNPEGADLVIVNSCGFIQSAKEESIEAVLSLARLKRDSDGRRLVMTGCLSQRYADELHREIPELDGIIGLNDIEALRSIVDGGAGAVVARSDNPATYPVCQYPRSVSATDPFAYIKISDGCDNRCSYCAIPDIRGPFRSRPIDDIRREAEVLLERGKRELILVSQESTAYGRELYGGSHIIPLLDSLSDIGGEYWIRVMYMHPARLEKELIDYMIDNQRICNYFDIPLQHINDDQLRSMGRRVTRRRIEELLAAIRAGKEPSAVRTNFIVGFPGETDAHFEELCRFVEQERFERLGGFEYSAEEGTPAASRPDQVPEETRQWRYHRLMDIQQKIAFERNRTEIDRRYDVIVDAIDSTTGDAICRTRFDAPEIDQTVRVKAGGMAPSDFATVRITGCDDYDLLGEREAV